MVWLQSARVAREKAIDYIADNNYAAAFSVMDEIANQTARLRQYPNMGRKGRVKGTRELIIQRTSFIVVYRLSGDRIEIVDFVHMAQNH
jgi:toxin ParE1/3/4